MMDPCQYTNKMVGNQDYLINDKMLRIFLKGCKNKVQISMREENISG